MYDNERDYIEYYSSLVQKEISFGVLNEDYEKFICALNEVYKDDYKRIEGL